MGHSLQALLFQGDVEPSRTAAMARAVPLHEGIVLVPLTDELFDHLAGHSPADGSSWEDVFFKFHPAVAEFGRAVAGDRPFAYVETEYFGGAGSQAAAVWRGDDCLMAPRSAPIGPINEALTLLGVTPSGSLDAFDTVGLSRHRHMEDWLE